MTIRVSDYIAQELYRLGVDTVFLVSGGGMMYLVDAVGLVPGLKYVCNHHEQACAMAAEGYAREKSALGVCYATSGPGATNILTGLVGAWLDSSPVLFLTGQSKRSQTIRGSGIPGLRQFGTFEVDIVPIVESVTKYAVMLERPEDVRIVLSRAIHAATTGRPGPVLIDIPLDVQGALVDAESLPAGDTSANAPATLGAADARAILSDIAQAERPLVLAGNGIRTAGAAAAFRALTHELGVPVVTTQLGKDVLPFDDAYFVGHPGVKGDRAGNLAVQNADVILSLGSSLHAQTTGYEAELFAPHARILQIELDPAVIARQEIKIARAFESDVAAAIQALRNALSESAAGPERFAAWRERCREWKRLRAVNREPHRIDEGPINFYQFADVLSDEAANDATIVTDAGSAFYVLGQAFRAKAGQRYLVSGGLGSMGYALPASLGVAAAAPDKTVICVTGDGSLQTNIQELQTLRFYNFNVKVFVINNAGYASIMNTQKGFFAGHYVGVDERTGVSMPPLELIAAAYNIPYVRATEAGTLAATVRSALALPGPVICDVIAQPDQVIIPTVTSEKLPDGRLRSKPIDEMYPYLT